MGSLTDVAGLRVGHAQSPDGQTGCTVVLCPPGGAVGGVDVRGSAPGTRETDLLRPGQLVERVHAVLLTGGSAFGLAAADGVMRWLEEHGIGFATPAGVVPIVPAAVLFDASAGQPGVRPDAALGYTACTAASAGPVPMGRVGAGAGATVGKFLGQERASPAGIGSASVRLPDGTVVAALIAVNALGNVVDPASGRVVAGARLTGGDGFAAAEDALLGGAAGGTGAGDGPVFGNTTIGVVATNAALDKAQANKLAEMAHTGLARTIVPVHTLLDGDCLFALATGEQPGKVDAFGLSRLGLAAAAAVQRAVLRAVQPTAAADAGPTSSGHDMGQANR